jgi:subtilisin family serine protease
MRVHAIPIAAIPARLSALLAVLIVLAALAAPASADDDDADDNGAAPGAAGAPAGGGEQGGVRGRLGPNPGRDFRRDVRDLMGLLFGRAAPPRPLPPPPAPPDAPEAEPRELVARGLGPSARAQAQAEGFEVIATRGLTTRLRAPPGLDLTAARARLQAIAPAAIVDLNHLFRPGSRASGCAGAECARPPSFALVAWPDDPSCGAGLALGLIDTPIDPVAAGLGERLEAIALLGPDRLPASAGHGTAVAALLAGDGKRGVRGLLPFARVVAVAAFHRRAEGDAADAFDIAAAIDHLAERGLAVAAMPFAGPANVVVEAAGAAAARQGVAAVAAAGNDGADAPPRFPAAYSWAVAVTGVDRDRRVYPLAVRGPHIAFAAPGVGLSLPAPGGTTVTRSGTSFAVPFVAAALALARRGGVGPAEATALLAEAAADLGPPGRDPTYGWGLVRALGGC